MATSNKTYKATASKAYVYKVGSGGNLIKTSGYISSGTTFIGKAYTIGGNNLVERFYAHSVSNPVYYKQEDVEVVEQSANTDANAEDAPGTVDNVSYDAVISKGQGKLLHSDTVWPEGTIVFSDLKAAGTAAYKTSVKVIAISSARNTTGVIYYKISIGGAEYWIDSTYVETESQRQIKENEENYKEDLLKESANLVQTYRSSSDSVNYDGFMLKSLMGIHGVPYQFMDNVDCKYYYNSSGKMVRRNFGRKYGERIIANMPLVLFSPGEPDFLPTFSKNDKNTIMTKLNSLIKGKDTTSKLGQLLSSSGRYYTFKFKYDQYYQYVNDALRQCSIYLGIQNKVYNGHKFANFKWQDCVNSALNNFIFSQEYVAFYMDSDNSVSESVSTSTTQSQLAEKINETSEIAKEVQFLAGPIAGLRIEAMDQEGYDATMKDIQNINNKYLGNSRLFSNLAEMFTTIGKGAKILFPEIWSDSSYTKSYNIKLKFRTPDADPVSWYLNICVPLMHIFCLAMPRAMGPNGYRAPFLVRAYSKGLFNCDLGIISDMSITKGKEGAWTMDGLPTEVDVDITIKDLYDTMFISKTSDPDGDFSGSGVKNFLQNTAYMDYLSNLCGININKPEIERTVENYLILTKNKVPDYFSYKWLGLKNDISNKALKAYSLLLGKK